MRLSKSRVVWIKILQKRLERTVCHIRDHHHPRRSLLHQEGTGRAVVDVVDGLQRRGADGVGMRVAAKFGETTLFHIW